MKIRKHIVICLVIGLLSIATSYAQSPGDNFAPAATAEHQRVALSHLDIGLSVGSTGLALDLSTPATDWLRVRAGVTYMPRFIVPMTFGLESFDLNGINTNKFDKMRELMKDFLDIDIDDHVKMNAKCTMIDFKFLLDFYPIPDNKHWRVTAGFHWGSSKVGHIENTIYEMPTLVGVTMYNGMYDYFCNNVWLNKPLYGNIFFDPEMGMKLKEKFQDYGRVGVHLGDFVGQTVTDANGNTKPKPYIMEPDENCMVLANMYVNSFKPYLGLGFDKALSQNEKWNMGIDLGCLLWGGIPDIITHPNLNMIDDPGEPQTVNLTKDVTGIKGKVGDYVDIAKKFKVFPVLNFRVSYRI